MATRIVTPIRNTVQDVASITPDSPSGEQLAQLREQMAKLEGLLEGLREAITGSRAA